MANQHNLACPQCHSPDEVHITVIREVEGWLVEDGVDYDYGGDFFWVDGDPARCGCCGWQGQAEDLARLQPGDPGYIEEETEE